MPGVVTCGLFNLDHFSAKIGQHLAGKRRSHAVAHLDHHMAGKRTFMNRVRVQLSLP